MNARQARQYLSFVASVFLIGTVVNRLRNREPSPAHTHPVERRLQSQYQERAEMYAKRMEATSIASWTTHRSDNLELVVEGSDASGQEVLSVVFDEKTGRLVSMLRLRWPDKPIERFSGKPLRAIARSWLDQLDLPHDGSWQWVEERVTPLRAVGHWKGSSFTLSLSINHKTGYLIAVRIHQEPK